MIIIGEWFLVCESSIEFRVRIDKSLKKCEGGGIFFRSNPVFDNQSVVVYQSIAYLINAKPFSHQRQRIH